MSGRRNYPQRSPQFDSYSFTYKILFSFSSSFTMNFALGYVAWLHFILSQISCPVLLYWSNSIETRGHKTSNDKVTCSKKKWKVLVDRLFESVFFHQVEGVPLPHAICCVSLHCYICALMSAFTTTTRRVLAIFFCSIPPPFLPICS